MPEVRALGPNDLQTMRDMLSLFGAAFDDLDTYTAEQPPDHYLRALLASSTFIAIAALERSEVVGGLAAYVLPKFEQARSRATLQAWPTGDTSPGQCQAVFTPKCSPRAAIFRHGVRPPACETCTRT